MTFIQGMVALAGCMILASMAWVGGAAWAGHFTRLRLMERKCIWDCGMEVGHTGLRARRFDTGCGKSYTVARQPGSQTYNMAFCPGCGAMVVPKSVAERRGTVENHCDQRH